MGLTSKSALATSGVLAALVGVIVSVSPLAAAAQTHVASQVSKAIGKADAAPRYRYDPTWPKPLPNEWILGPVTGITTDRHGNVWVLNRPAAAKGSDDFGAEAKPPTSECCVHAPAVIAFSPKGDVLQAWGGPGYVPGWPIDEHTVLVDSRDHVWVAGSGGGDTLLEFTADGKLLRDWGNRGPKFEGPANKMTQNNQETDLLLRGVSSAALDEKAHEVFIADGYLNRRVMVYDIDTGKFKRGWGAYGKPLSEIDNVWAAPRKPNEPPRKDFTQAVHCVVLGKDGLVYVCDRGGDRVQVFTKAGKFVREYIVAPQATGRGTVAGLALSPDAGRKWLFVSDMQDSTIWIIDRETGKTVGRIGHHSYEGGDFTLLHVSTADSHGNIYTGELGTAARVQKFSPVQ